MLNGRHGSQCFLLISHLFPSFTLSLVAAQGATPKATQSVMSWPDQDSDGGKTGPSCIRLWPNSVADQQAHKTAAGGVDGISGEA